MPKLAVIGAGNAGCVSALHFRQYLPELEIDLYHDSEHHPIERVGQGTTIPVTNLLSNSLGCDWYDNKIGATIGTTTTAISIKSRKNPSIKITNITITNLVQKPPGKEFKYSLTNSSPPKALNAAVNIAAPNKILKTKDVVLAVSSITPCIVLPNLKSLQQLHAKAIQSIIDPTDPKKIPILSSKVLINFTFIL